MTKYTLTINNLSLKDYLDKLSKYEKFLNMNCTDVQVLKSMIEFDFIVKLFFNGCKRNKEQELILPETDFKITFSNWQDDDFKEYIDIIRNIFYYQQLCYFSGEVFEFNSYKELLEFVKDSWSYRDHFRI